MFSVPQWNDPKISREDINENEEELNSTIVLFEIGDIC